MSKGTIIKDNGGRIVNPDGTFIRPQGNETFLQAVTRQHTPQTHLITIVSPNVTKDDSSDDEVYVIPAGDDEEEEAVEVYPADVKGKGKAREKFDGVFIPPLKRDPAKAQAREKEREKENIPVPPAVAKTKKNKADPEPQVIRRVQPSRDKDTSRQSLNKSAVDPTPSVQVPFDVKQPDLDSDDDDIIMEDPQAQKPAPSETPMDNNPINPPVTNKAAQRKKPQPRQSAISAYVDPMRVLDHVLNTEVRMALGEVLGVSNKLSDLLVENMKKKSAPKTAMVATSFITRDRGLLIRLKMEIDHIPVIAIIDTGSQLNIVNTALWKKTVQRPMDKTQSISMNDANGGKGVLLGLVQNVPLHCGGVPTHANLYVGSHVPFQLLLGRPWQRGNYISIDERLDGTWLIFKDPKDLEPRYEILVQPEENPDWDVNINFPNFPGIFMITVPRNQISKDNGMIWNNEVTRTHIEGQGRFLDLGSFNETMCSRRYDQIRDISEQQAANFKLSGIEDLAKSGNLEEIRSKLDVAPTEISQFYRHKNCVIERMTQEWSRGLNSLKLDNFSKFYPPKILQKSPQYTSRTISHSILPNTTMQRPHIPEVLDHIDAVKFNYALVTPNSVPLPHPAWPNNPDRNIQSTLSRALRSVDQLAAFDQTRSMAISSPNAIELGTQIDNEGNIIRELLLPHAAIFTDGENTSITHGHAFIKLYSFKEYPVNDEFTVTFPSFDNSTPTKSVECQSPVLEYPDSDSDFNQHVQHSPLYSPSTRYIDTTASATGDIDLDDVMAIGAHSPTNTDRCGISGVSDDELEYHNHPHPSRRQYPSLPPRRLNSYPTEYHPEEAEDVRSVTTEPEELVPHANPIPFIAPPPSRAKYSTYPIQSTRETRYEAQHFLCGFHGTDYLQHYGTPSECCSDPECSDRLLDPISHSELHSDNDSMPGLVTVPDSSEDEEENRWIRTKDFPESLVTKAKRIALEKKRRMVRDRIDERKRARILRVARDNEQGLEEGEICPLCDREGTMPVTTPALDPHICRTPEVLTITVLSSDPAAVRAATLDNERAGLNAIIEKAKVAVLCDEDMDVQSSTSDLEHNVVLEAMNSFIHDARHYRLISNHHPPMPSPWDEDHIAPNVDETHFCALQDGLDIIISDTPSSPSSDFILGQLQIFATWIPLYR